MQHIILYLLLLNLLQPVAMKTFETDTLATPQGNLVITFIGHGSLMFEHAGKVIHIDPVMAEADYTTMPKADVILITHHHSDHFDPTAIRHLLKPSTSIGFTRICQDNTEDFPLAFVLGNGQRDTLVGMTVDAVPAYNILHRRPNGEVFHPKGDGNGYVIDFSGFKVYIAGDTEDIPEMAQLQNIDVAFLPMNLPYTMTPEMVARAARLFKPAILYPYHFGATDTQMLCDLLKDTPDIQVRIRELR